MSHSQISTNEPSIPIDTSKKDTLKLLPVFRDSLAPKPKYKKSKDAIEDEIKYSAIDSILSDLDKKEIHLYGGALVEYQTIKLSADYIIVNFDVNYVQAFYSRDEKYKPKESPSFVDGATKLGFKEMKYNYKTKKAISKNSTTQESEFFLLGEKSKFVGKENDTINHEDKFYNSRAIVTTCNHPIPHFGIRSKKMKLIPDKLAVVGPSQLEIMGIPTPIVLPFGFFPLVKGQSSGLIFPSNYQYQEQYGFGLEGIGYYFPINDYVDAKVLTTIWSRGTFSGKIESNYKKRYKYTGNFSFNYTNNVLEDAKGKKISAKSYGIVLSHNQDSKAHPYRSLSGSINFQTNRNQQRNNFDYATQLNNTITSNLNFGYRFPESPFSMTAAFQHRANNLTRKVTMTLPSATFTMNTIQPFKRKNATGDRLWYEDISLNYNASLKNFVESTDTTIFTKKTIEDLQPGFKHGSILSTSISLFKYIKLNPSINYEETYFLKTLEKSFDFIQKYDTIKGQDAEGNEIVLELRTKSYGTTQEKLINDFNIFRKFSAGVGMNTQMFWTYRRSTGWFRGIRHKISPNIGFNFTPDTKSKYARYYEASDNLGRITSVEYNPYQTGPDPQSYGIKQMALTYGFSSILEAKFRGGKDTVDKKVTLFNNLSLNGNYNFAADSFQWSNINFNGNTSLFKGMSNLNFNLTWTPYEVNYKTGRLINQLLIKSQKKPVQLLNFNANISTNLTYSRIKEMFSSNKVKDDKANSDTNKKVFKLASIEDLIKNLSLNHSFSMSVQKTKTGKDTLFVGANSIYISGSLPLTPTWTFNIGSISYDIKNKSLVYPSFGFSKNLHCWQMNFSWVPQSGYYTFFIGVASGALNFIKYEYNQPYIPRF